MVWKKVKCLSDWMAIIIDNQGPIRVGTAHFCFGVRFGLRVTGVFSDADPAMYSLSGSQLWISWKRSEERI